MKRGDIVTVATSGDFGKPRPAVVVQSDDMSDIETTLVALLTTSDSRVSTFRVALEPTLENGLRERSYIMLDKIMVVWRVKCRSVIGALTSDELERVDAGLALVLGLDG